jgi:hypothetical protein
LFAEHGGKSCAFLAARADSPPPPKGIVEYFLANEPSYIFVEDAGKIFKYRTSIYDGVTADRSAISRHVALTCAIHYLNAWNKHKETK